MEGQAGFRNDGGVCGLEALAILDNSGFSNSEVSCHLNDDRIAFLEAIRVAFLLRDNGSAPSREIFQAIFHILRDADSLVLTVESYELLLMLDKRFPRVLISDSDGSNSSPTTDKSLNVAWQPFSFGLDSINGKETAKKYSKSSLDSLDFHNLVKDIAEVTNQMSSETVETNLLKNMYLLQYLISALESDFLPRNSTYQDNLQWTLLRESLLFKLLGSRKIVYKVLIKHCLHIMSELPRWTSISEELAGANMEIALSFPEVKMSTLAALRKFFVVVMELDMSWQIADKNGLTNRADRHRTAVIDIILDELIYDSGHLHSFLQAFEAKQKLEIIVRYFQKYMPKSSVRTRRSSGSIGPENFDGVLKFLGNINNSRGILKKLSSQIVQLLLAYAFQAYLALLCRPKSKDFLNNNPFEVCESIVSAFTNLKRENPNDEILKCGKEALLAAAAIMSSSSKT